MKLVIVVVLSMIAADVIAQPGVNIPSGVNLQLPRLGGAFLEDFLKLQAEVQAGIDGRELADIKIRTG